MPKVFKIIPPSIPSAGVYLFTTDSGVRYEVRFGRKQTDILSVNIVFGVLNEEYDGEEYALTNRGEFYSVMATLEVIIHNFLAKNPNIHTLEFAGEPIPDSENAELPTKRTLVYLKYAARIFNRQDWQIEQIGNKVIIRRISR